MKYRQRKMIQEMFETRNPQLLVATRQYFGGPLDPSLVEASVVEMI
jgi:hypothetical protein